MSNALNITYVNPVELKFYDREIRKLGKKQVEKTCRLIESVGFCIPVILDTQNRVIVGRAFVEAARQMQIEVIPAVQLAHLTDEQARVLRLAYSRLMEEESWISDALAEELHELEITYPDLDLTITGFDIVEIDSLLDIHIGTPEEEYPLLEPTGVAVSRLGDIWQMGEHRIICGDSTHLETYHALMQGDQAQMSFWDPPYNVPIKGHVCGLGSIQHDEFAMAAGEMTEAQFTAFLQQSFAHVAAASAPGAIHFVCMDWRHTVELQLAARSQEFELKNICVWVKDNGGMGSLYRSRHELVFVFKHGDAPHINNVQLGKHGRYRTNVWEFPGVNTIKAGRMQELAMHPTVKPVGLVMEAIKDCSRRGGIVLDPYGGSGTTLIACEKSGRIARIIEIDPKYVDVTVRRWQKLTGRQAILQNSSLTFDEATLERSASGLEVPHVR